MASTEHKTLAEAKVAFQGDAPKLHKGNTAEVVSKRTGGKYSYKYVDLADIVEAIQPLMLKHGLAFSAFPCFGPDGNPALRYELEHATGDKEADVMPLLAVPDAQALGSAITYMRRYALCAVLNIVADADDDGAAAKAAQDRTRAQNGQPPRQAPQTTAEPAQPSERAASGPQKGAINARLAAGSVKEDDAKAILQWAAGTAVVDRVSKAAASKLIDRLGQDGSGAQEILDEISTEAERGDERARTIVSRYFEVTPHA